ncbi:hypothetical protein [Streptomyces stelliscabiei]|uniref:hypothetical protein n=1 Tax=Streptomyces stelliscabiei TaxID=146820 RepID=UPI0029A8141B|nr:hypothetical protein [Streptomyces stelliscabiei]MDX2552782.1 hypothetical protein [Streptomyces stelliscabiei]
MKGTVHIQVGRFDAKVHSPFEAKDYIKDLPRTWRHWDKAEKCWVVELYAVDTLVSALSAAGFTVRTTRPAGSSYEYNAPPPRAERTKETWADSMYKALGKDLADKAYKALVPVLHPDRGGDTVCMQQLNAARDKAKLQPAR